MMQMMLHMVVEVCRPRPSLPPYLHDRVSGLPGRAHERDVEGLERLHHVREQRLPSKHTHTHRQAAVTPNDPRPCQRQQPPPLSL